MLGLIIAGLELVSSGGQREDEGRALAELGLHGHQSTVVLDDLLADREADAGAGALAAVQTLEDDEDTRVVARIDPDAVVAHGEAPYALQVLPPHNDDRALVAAELDGVRDQVAEELRDLHGV